VQGQAWGSCPPTRAGGPVPPAPRLADVVPASFAGVRRAVVPALPGGSAAQRSRAAAPTPQEPVSGSPPEDHPCAALPLPLHDVERAATERRLVGTRAEGRLLPGGRATSFRRALSR